MGERAGPSRCGRRLVGNRFAELHPDPLRRRRARGLGQWARVLLQNAPNFGSVLALPLGVEAGGLEHRAEWRRIRTIEHDTRLGQLRLGILVEARDVFTL